MQKINEVRPFGAEKATFWLTEQSYMNKPLMLKSYKSDYVELNDTMTTEMISMLCSDKNDNEFVIATTSKIISDIVVNKIGHGKLPVWIKFVQKNSRKSGYSYYTIVDAEHEPDKALLQ